LATVLNQVQRDKACAAYRQAQWNDYNARQRAIQDQRKAQADAQAAAAQQEEAAREQVEAGVQTERAAAARAAEASRVRQAKLAKQHAIEEAQAAEAAEQARRQRYIELVKAENSPENVCRDPKVAREVLDGWNGLDNMKDIGLKVIDIGHLTTSSAEQGPSGGSITCHGIFETNRGVNVLGSLTLKHNVAGDPMVVWLRDADQDLTQYEAPKSLDVKSPDLSNQSKLGGPNSLKIIPATSTSTGQQPSRL
jgi:multidrug efflux pump subunit AcrA (membrane-fusion protein)